MRRIYKGTIAFKHRQELFKRQRLAISQEAARAEWNKYRKSVKSRAIVEALGKSVGVRQRCIYCCDSRSADVDHFVPIAIDFTKAFKWANFIWVCPECNRRKGKRFPLDSEGTPLIIDPTRLDPWNHLILDTANGLLAPRFLDDDFDAKGEATLEVLSCVNFESVTEGRKRVIRRYYEAVDHVLKAEDSPSAFSGVAREVREDEYGIASWFALREGAMERRFLQLKEQHPIHWRTFVRLALQN